MNNSSHNGSYDTCRVCEGEVTRDESGAFICDCAGGPVEPAKSGAVPSVKCPGDGCHGCPGCRRESDAPPERSGRYVMWRLSWLRILWRRFRYARGQGVIVVERWAQSTPRPQVTASVYSRRGAQSVYTFDADESGTAQAVYYGQGLASILGIPFVDKT